MLELLIPSERRVHKEIHGHRCPIHARGKCHHADGTQICNQCYKDEDNAICQKTLRGTGLTWHHFPCVSCMTVWRNQYGGEAMVDAFIDAEQAQRHNEIVPDAKLAERERERNER